MNNERPVFVNQEDIDRWNLQIQADKVSDTVLEQPLLVEVIYSGLWLVEQLQKLQCPSEYIMRIQYTAAAASFGRDPWEMHQYYLDAYKNNQLEFEPDLENLN